MLTLNDGRNELWQWDTKRKLTVDAECSQVHFSNKVFGRSIDMNVVDGIAIIPDILLQTDKDLIAWAFVGTAENGYTKISKVFKVNKRNKPADYVFTPPEQTTLEEIKEKIEYLESIQDPDSIKDAVNDYLEQNPVEAPVQSVNGKTGEVELTAEDVGAISRDELQETTNKALAQAKASGEFDGADGKDGEDYVLTNEDKQKIAEMAAELVEVPDSGGNVDLTGVVKSVNGVTPDENGNVQIAVSSGGAGWTTAQIDLLDSLFSAIPWTTGTAGALADSLIASLRSTSSGSGGNTGGGSGGESGGEDEPETGATDNITQSGNTLIITSLATAPIQSGSVLTIA